MSNIKFNLYQIYQELHTHNVHSYLIHRQLDYINLLELACSLILLKWISEMDDNLIIPIEHMAFFRYISSTCRSWSVHKNLTLHRVRKIIFSFCHHKVEIRSFPTMYNTWGCSLGRNGPKKRFSPKKWSKNTNFGGNGPGSSNFEVGWDPQF